MYNMEKAENVLKEVQGNAFWRDRGQSARKTNDNRAEDGDLRKTLLEEIFTKQNSERNVLDTDIGKPSVRRTMRRYKLDGTGKNGNGKNGNGKNGVDDVHANRRRLRLIVAFGLLLHKYGIFSEPECFSIAACALPELDHFMNDIKSRSSQKGGITKWIRFQTSRLWSAVVSPRKRAQLFATTYLLILIKFAEANGVSFSDSGSVCSLFGDIPAATINVCTKTKGRNEWIEGVPKFVRGVAKHATKFVGKSHATRVRDILETQVEWLQNIDYIRDNITVQTVKDALRSLHQHMLIEFSIQPVQQLGRFGSPLDRMFACMCIVANQAGLSNPSAARFRRMYELCMSGNKHPPYDKSTHVHINWIDSEPTSLLHAPIFQPIYLELGSSVLRTNIRGAVQYVQPTPTPNLMSILAKDIVKHYL